MHLIGILAAGVSGAESGTAEIYVRGTSTRATYYTNYEGTSSVSTGADVALDSNGGATIYVNQNVDVDVKDSNGSRVRFFTEMVASPIVEYSGQSFTGTDYITGASATSNPTSLQDILDGWYTSAGATDYNVLLGGSSTTIQAALGSFYGYFYNVQSSAYGAEGDGVTDDTTSITAAITAAAVNGGIVFFPPGTYRVTTALAIPPGVSLLGIGSGQSIITMDHASNTLLDIDGGSSSQGHQFVEGLTLTAAQSYSGTLVLMDNDDTYITISRCLIGGSNTTGVITTIQCDDSFVSIRDCIFAPGAIQLDSYAVESLRALPSASSPSLWTNITGCTFLFPASQSSNCYMLHVQQCSVSNCIFEASAVSAAITISCIDRDPSGAVQDQAAVYGCSFVGSATATVYGIDPSGNGGGFFEFFNVIDSNMAGLYPNFSIITATTDVVLGSRERRYYLITDNSAALVLPTHRYETIHVIRTDGTVQVISAAYRAPRGSYLTVVIENNRAGAATANIDFGSGFRENVGLFTIADGYHRVFRFVSTYVASSTQWCLISDSGDISG